MPPRRALLPALALVGAFGGCDGCSTRSPAPAASSAQPPASARPVDALSTLRWDDAPPDWNAPLPATPPGGIAERGYVGSEACRDCHTALYDTYARHSMARTGMRPLASLDKKWLSAIFDRGSKDSVLHARSGFSYRPVRQGDRYFIEETVVASDGERVHTWLQPIAFALSAGSYGMSFYFRRGGRFVQVPIDYYAKRERWDLDPGAAQGNIRFMRSLDAACFSCHGDYPRRRAASDDVFFDPMPTGVGCERCHGPGEAHAKSARAEDIVNPARLSNRQKLDVCAQCHESSQSTLREGRDEFSYRPGEPLDAYRANFVGAPPDPDRFHLLAHAERMALSACFRGSSGKLVCTSCHDPHKSSLEQTPAYWDAKCTSCHDEKKCTASADERKRENDHCVRCHMREGSPSAPTQVTVTDHWIQKRPPPIRAGEPSAERLVDWATLVGGERAPGSDWEAVLAIAHQHAGKAEDALRLAASAAPARPKLVPLYALLAKRYAAVRQPWNGARALATALRIDPNSRAALFEFAEHALDSPPPLPAEGMRALDRLLALDPEDVAALEMKAAVLFRRGEVEAARPLFVRAAASGAPAARAHVALAAIALREGRRADAIAELELARHVEPGDGWVLSKLAESYAAANDRARADDVERAKKHFAARPGGLAPSDASRWLPEAFR